MAMVLGMHRVAGWLAAGAFLGLVAAGCAAQDPAALQDFPGTTRQQIVQERASPAVQVIQTEYRATVSIPSFAVNEGALQNLVDQIARQALGGQIGLDDKSLRDAYTKGIAANPDAYLSPQQPGQSSVVTVDYQCSGFVVTPDGYVVTAAHCLDVPQDERQDAYVKTGLQPLIDGDVKQFQDVAARDGTFDSDERGQLASALSSFLQRHEQVSNETSSLATAFYSFTSTGQHQVAKSPVSVVSAGKAPPKSTGPFGDKDVSIVKVDGHNDLPTLPVASDEDIEGGQQLFIDGYPGDFQGGTLDKVAPPTVTSGPVTSKKVSDSGVPLLETTATTSPGSSGSPGLDDAGRMVGVVSYGSGQYGYLIGGSVVQQYLREKNIQPRQSTITRLYDVALNDYHREYYKRALPEFQQVKGLYAGHPYVDAFIQRTQEALQQGRDRTPLLDGTALLLVAGGAGGLFVLLATALTALLLVRSRSRRRRPPAGAPPQGWGGAPAPPQPPPAPVVSPDGYWRWDGERWVPAVTSAPAAPQDPAPPDRRDYPPPPGYR